MIQEPLYGRSVDTIVLFKMLYGLNKNPSINKRPETPLVKPQEKPEEETPPVETPLVTPQPPPPRPPPTPTLNAPLDVIVLFKMLYGISHKKIPAPPGKPIPVIPGTIPVIPGTIPVIPGTIPVIPGKNPVIPGTLITPIAASTLTSPVSTVSLSVKPETSITRKDDNMEWRTIIYGEKCGQREEKHFDLVCFQKDYKITDKVSTKNIAENKKYATFTSETDEYGSFIYTFRQNPTVTPLVETVQNIQDAMNENCDNLLYLFEKGLFPDLKTEGILLQGVSSNAKIKCDEKTFTLSGFMEYYEEKVKQGGSFKERIEVNKVKKSVIKTAGDFQQTIQQIYDLEPEPVRINETILVFNNTLLELNTNYKNIIFYEPRMFLFYAPIELSKYDIYSGNYGTVETVSLKEKPIEFVQLLPKGATPPTEMEQFYYEYLGAIPLSEIQNILVAYNGPKYSIKKPAIMGGAIQKNREVLFRYGNAIYASGYLDCKGATEFPPTVKLTPVIVSEPLSTPVATPVEPTVVLSTSPKGAFAPTKEDLKTGLSSLKSTPVAKPVSPDPESKRMTLEEILQDRRKHLRHVSDSSEMPTATAETTPVDITDDSPTEEATTPVDITDDSPTKAAPPPPKKAQPIASPTKANSITTNDSKLVSTLAEKKEPAKVNVSSSGTTQEKPKLIFLDKINELRKYGGNPKRKTQKRKK